MTASTEYDFTITDASGSRLVLSDDTLVEVATMKIGDEVVDLTIDDLRRLERAVGHTFRRLVEQEKDRKAEAARS